MTTPAQPDCPHMTGDASCTVCLSLAAVRALVERCLLISPRALIEVSVVAEALNTGRLPNLSPHALAENRADGQAVLDFGEVSA